MKKFGLVIIFLSLAIFLAQEVVFAEIDESEQRAKEISDAAEKYKRKIVEKEIIEKDEIKKEVKVKKIPSKLIKLLPTENELEEITSRIIWKYVDKQSTLDDEVKIETMTSLLRDITRVYDPIVNKYKVSTIQIEIIKYDDRYELEYYWNEISESSLEKIFNNAYLVGSPNDDIECMFNYSKEGAITICKTEEYVVKSIIFDKYQEHFAYSKLKVGSEKLELNQDEITTRIVEKILENIEKDENEYELYKILKSNKEIKEMKQKEMENRKEENKKMDKEKFKVEEQNKNKLLGVEKDRKYGIQKFSCIKDDFGLITISGQFNNNEIKKDKLILEILFLDYEQKIIFKNTAKLLELDEFETKRFLGNTKIDKPFTTCTIKISN